MSNNDPGHIFTVITQQPTCITNRADSRWRFLEPPTAVYPTWSQELQSCNFFRIQNSEKVGCCKVHGEYEIMNEKHQLLFKCSVKKNCCGQLVRKVIFKTCEQVPSIEIDYEQTGICSFYEKDLIHINSPEGISIGFVSKRIFALVETSYLIWDIHNRVRFRVEPLFHLAKGKEYQVLENDIVVAHIYRKNYWKYVMSTCDYLSAFDKANLLCLVIIMDIDVSS